ncbi:EamA/RhaT family transporter [Photobacterium sanctipauli]|uniref:EamA/RhaT family transporter n=1 Tax=Photobacterium sanctipauli TaxID=1342794 RepID=A0A2T3NYL9_9GAMM|nr:DMT family transporter [Photobacterium sanctipauli]PSW21376.1 EamA/RhaT family transporter [Photobacterium sanctipauli]
MSNTAKGWIAATFVALLWGAEGSLATLPLQMIDAQVIVWLRYLIASVVLFIVLAVSLFSSSSHREKPIVLHFRWENRKDILSLFLCGVVGQGLFSFFSFLSLDYISIAENGVIQGLVPIAILLMGTLFYGERFTIAQMGAAVVALAGVTLLVFSPSSDQQGVNIGHFICLLSVLSFASVTHLRANLAKQYGAAQTMFYQFGFAALGFFFYLMFGDVDVSGVWLILTPSYELLCILILGSCVSGLGYLVYIYSIERVGVDGSSMALNLMPVSAFLIGKFVFDEEVTPLRIIAMCLIVGGMVLFVTPKKTQLTYNIS